MDDGRPGRPCRLPRHEAAGRRWQHQAELAAIELALRAAEGYQGPLAIFTDCQSGVKALAKYSMSPECIPVYRLLAERQATVYIAHVFSHVGTELNEAADRAATAAHAEPASTDPPTGRALVADDLRTIARESDEAAVASAGLSFFTAPGPRTAWGFEEKHLPMRVYHALCELRVGVTKRLGNDAWMHRKDTDERPACRRCGEKALGREGATIKHIFRCMTGDAVSMRAALQLGDGFLTEDLWTSRARAMADYLDWYGETYPDPDALAAFVGRRPPEPAPLHRRPPPPPPDTSSVSTGSHPPTPPPRSPDPVDQAPGPTPPPPPTGTDEHFPPTPRGADDAAAGASPKGADPAVRAASVGEAADPRLPTQDSRRLR